MNILKISPRFFSSKSSFKLLTSRNISLSLPVSITPPISIYPFSVGEFGIASEEFCNEHLPVVKNLAPDMYDVRLGQIKFLIKHIKNFEFSNEIVNYYLGKSPITTLLRYYDKLPQNLKIEFNKINPFRYRAESNYEVRFQ